ncbi:hypothetical protein GCM10028812_33760 [Ancylobacter sonchi]|uniref:hypothetical protein n=1 Tax=Ancylobacter TaxID=99 RepID=UPI0028B0A07D|nr:hypothetical protein [Ancylobacter sonchi]
MCNLYGHKSNLAAITDLVGTLGNGVGNLAPHTVAIGRVNMGRQVLKFHLVALRYAPQQKRLFVHCELVVVYVP